jgi:sugar (pentulose or hexulose) kinase
VDGWVGLDVGTTSSKAMIYDQAGRQLGADKTRTIWRTGPDGVEIDANVLRAGALEALSAAVDSAPDNVRILGVGITSMGETGVLVDGHGRPVAPAIAWHDDRDHLEVSELDQEIGADVFGARAGKPLRGQFSLTKHRWLLRHNPAAISAVRRFNVAEWVARGLGSGEACDRSLACRTGWFDLAVGGWWQDALAWSGTSVDLMPPLVDSGVPIGRVSAAQAHPRLAGALVTLAGHDHQAAALGVGAVLPGDELDSSGTAEALVRTVLPDLSAEQVLALARAGITTDVSIQPQRWSLLGGTEGGLAMQRIVGMLGVTPTDLPGLDKQALTAVSGRVGVRGIGSDALRLSGITDGVGPGEVWRAVVEAATAEAVRLHQAMTAVAGPHNRFLATGGWCHSQMVLHAKRAGFGDVQVSDVSEAGTLGAATLAARATGGLDADEILGRSA